MTSCQSRPSQGDPESRRRIAGPMAFSELDRASLEAKSIRQLDGSNQSRLNNLQSDSVNQIGTPRAPPAQPGHREQASEAPKLQASALHHRPPHTPFRPDRHLLVGRPARRQRAIRPPTSGQGGVPLLAIHGSSSLDLSEIESSPPMCNLCHDGGPVVIGELPPTMESGIEGHGRIAWEGGSSWSPCGFTLKRHEVAAPSACSVLPPASQHIYHHVLFAHQSNIYNQVTASSP